MASVRALKSGNWSDPTVWNTGALPTAADDVWSNTFIVVIDISPTVLSIRNGSITGVTAGGWFVPTNGITLTCTGAGIVGSNGFANIHCFDSALSGAQSCAYVGNITGPSQAGSGLRNNGTGTVDVTGNVTGGIATSSYGIQNSASGTINVTGNATGGTGLASAGVANTSTGVINLTGTLTGGNNANGAAYGGLNNSGGTFTVTGTIQASTTCPGFGTLTTANGNNILTGPFLTSSNGVSPVFASKWFWLDTSPPATRYEVRSANLAVVRPLYTADSVGGNPAASNVRSGTVYGPNSELTGTCAVPGASSVLSGVPVDATTGTATISAADIRAAVGLASSNLDTQLAANPSAADIATAVWANATRTLTAAVYSTSDIASAVWSALTRTITGGTVDTLTNAPSVPSAATIATQVRTELSTELERIDVATSTRLAASGYTAPPSAASVASQVRTELTPELGRVANCATVETTGDQIAALQ